MAYQSTQGPFSFPCSADLSAKQYRFMVLNGSSQLAVCGAGARMRGILDNLPKATEMGRIWPCNGKALKVQVGAVAVALGALIASDANGMAITAVSGNYSGGVALMAGAAGDIITIWADITLIP